MHIKGIRLGDYSLPNIPTAFTVVEKDSNIYGNTMIGLLYLFISNSFLRLLRIPQNFLHFPPSNIFK